MVVMLSPGVRCKLQRPGLLAGMQGTRMMTKSGTDGFMFNHHPFRFPSRSGCKDYIA